MRFAFPLAVLLLIASSFAQNNTAPAQDQAATQIVQTSLAAQFGSTAISDVQLSGTVVTHFGKLEQGSITLEASAGGRSKVVFNTDSGSRTEYSSGHSEAAACTWTGADSKVHSVALHNCMTDGAWFFPLLSLPDAMQNSQATVSYMGSEQKNGTAAQHIVSSVSVVVSGKEPANGKALLQSLPVQNLFIDPDTLLPISLTFNVHPDNDAGKNIPVEIRFSDYRDVNGVKVPFHIEKLVNGGTLLEVTIQSATFNTGALATTGAAQ